jgi:hypothetical protein
MRTPFINLKNIAIKRVVSLAAVIGLLAALPLLIGAHPAALSIQVVNNSTGVEVRHIYLSDVNTDNWSADQLGGSVVTAGQSFTLSSVSCNQSQIKVISEDQNGCFLTTVVSCTGDPVWTITDSDTPDCGN